MGLITHLRNEWRHGHQFTAVGLGKGLERQSIDLHLPKHHTQFPRGKLVLRFLVDSDKGNSSPIDVNFWKRLHFRRLSLKPSDELIDKSVTTLQGYLDNTMIAVLNSTNECPEHMRAAFRNLNRRVSEHFSSPEYEVSHLSCNSCLLHFTCGYYY